MKPACLSIRLEIAAEAVENAVGPLSKPGPRLGNAGLMDKPVTVNLPQGIESFLAAAGWPGAANRTAAGRCLVPPLFSPAPARSRRRSAHRHQNTAMLMDAPPPHENPAPFLRAAQWLDANGMRAPRILHAGRSARAGPARRFRRQPGCANILMKWPADEDAVYAGAVDALVRLHRLPPGPFPDYDMTVYQREAEPAGRLVLPGAKSVRRCRWLYPGLGRGA